MILKQLELKNYRNHLDRAFSFDKKVTLIIGPNGAGKTNILEAIYLLSTGKPFRAMYDRDVITHSKDSATIKGVIKKENKEIRVGILIEKNQKYKNASIKRIKINGKSVRISTVSQFSNSVLFSPLNMDLLTASPSTRRRFLDDVLTQTEEGYKKALRDYTKARRQKNRILEIVRETGKGESQLDYWNQKMLQVGSEIQGKREHLIKFFSGDLNDKIKTMDLSLTVNIEYNISSLNKKRLEEYHEREIAAGTSLIGPHRDDFSITQEGRNVGNYASRGQQRTLILCLKICELEYIEKTVKERPILLLDDIFSELDKDHRATLKKIVGRQQTILTATETPVGFEDSPKINL